MLYDPAALVAVAEARPRGRWRDLLEERRFLAATLIAPAVIFILALVGGPLLLSVYLSLTDATGGTLHGHWVGLDNFTNAWSDPNFRRALRNTILFTVVSQAIVLVCAGLIAHALTRPIHGCMNAPTNERSLASRPISNAGRWYVLRYRGMPKLNRP